MVYSAEEKATKVKVAVKQMNLFAQPRTDLLVNEVAMLASLKHKNIINFIDGFLIDGRPHMCELWAVMELLEGGSLGEVVRKTVLRAGQVAAITECCVLALEYLHSKVRLLVNIIRISQYLSHVLR